MRVLTALLIVFVPNQTWANQPTIDLSKEQRIHGILMPGHSAADSDKPQNFNEMRCKRQIAKLTDCLIAVSRRKAFIQQVTSPKFSLQLQSWYKRDLKVHKDLEVQFFKQASQAPALPVTVDPAEALNQQLKLLADLLTYKIRLAQWQKASGDTEAATNSVISALRIISEAYFLTGKLPSQKQAREHRLVSIRAAISLKEFWQQAWDDFAVIRSLYEPAITTSQLAVSILESLHELGGESLPVLMSEERQQACAATFQGSERL